jgi:hypothetical protein
MHSKYNYKEGDEVTHFELIKEKYMHPLLSSLRGEGEMPRPPPNQYVELYTQNQRIMDVGNDTAFKVLKLYENFLKEYVENDVVPHLRKCLEARRVIEGLIKAWEDYTLVAYMLHRMFYYLDRFYLRKESNHGPRIGHRAKEIFY